MSTHGLGRSIHHMTQGLEDLTSKCAICVLVALFPLRFTDSKGQPPSSGKEAQSLEPSRSFLLPEERLKRSSVSQKV